MTKYVNCRWDVAEIGARFKPCGKILSPGAKLNFCEAHASMLPLWPKDDMVESQEILLAAYARFLKLGPAVLSEAELISQMSGKTPEDLEQCQMMLVRALKSFDQAVCSVIAGWPMMKPAKSVKSPTAR